MSQTFIFPIPEEFPPGTVLIDSTGTLYYRAAESSPGWTDGSTHWTDRDGVKRDWVRVRGPMACEPNLRASWTDVFARQPLRVLTDADDLAWVAQATTGGAK